MADLVGTLLRAELCVIVTAEGSDVAVEGGKILTGMSHMPYLLRWLFYTGSTCAYYTHTCTLVCTLRMYSIILCFDFFL